MTATLHRTGWAAAILALATLGWLLAGGDDPPPAPGASRPPTRERQAAHHRGPPAPVQAALRVIRAAPTPVERLRATIELADSLPVADIAAWLNGHWFDLRGGPELMVFNHILTTRWQHEDPAACAAWAMTHDGKLAEATLDAWARREPQAVLAFFKEHPDDRLEMLALSPVSVAEPALALTRLKELLDRSRGGRPFDQYALCVLIDTLAVTAPAQLNAALDILPLVERRVAETALVAQRLKVDFDGELRRLIERSGGMGYLAGAIDDMPDAADMLLARVHLLPPKWKQAVAERPELLLNQNHPEKLWRTDLEAAGFSADQVRELREKVLDRLTTSQPRQVLGWLDEVELSSETRRDLIESCLRFADSPSEKTGMVALLKTAADRQAATAFLEEQAARPPEVERAPDPGEWLAEAAAWDVKTSRFVAFSGKLPDMTREQLEDLQQRFQKLPEVEKLKAAKALTFTIDHDFAPSLKGDAIRCLVASPPNGNTTGSRIQSPVSLAADHAAHWAQTDPTAAGAWAITLPPGAPKLWAMRNLAATWATYDPAAANQWVDSLPPADRKEVADYLKPD